MPIKLLSIQCYQPVKPRIWRFMSREERKMYWRDRKNNPDRYLESQLKALNKI